MDSCSFYKSLYDRELTRRVSLDGAVGLPVTALTIIVALNSQIVKDEIFINSINDVTFAHLTLCSLIYTCLISIFYIIRSFNNLFKGFAYKNVAYVTNIRKYELQVRDYNTKVPLELTIEFEAEIIKKLNDLTDDHIIFNDKRSKDLQLARKYLVVSLIITILNYLLIIIDNIRL